jgi:drug/metabolite transporter (DMT)-like permease
LQRIAAAGMPPAAISVFAYGSVGLAGLPWLWRERKLWLRRKVLLVLIALFGGWANASFVIAFTIGDVVREMLLFYLAPAWTLLGARFVLHERLRPRRALAIAIAMFGAVLVIAAGGPLGNASITIADVLALSAGIAFAANNVTMRFAGEIPISCKTVAQMLGCSALSLAAMLATGVQVPAVSASLALGLAAFAIFVVALGSSTTSYGVTHLEANRASLLILSELVAAVLSASLVLQRVPSTLEVAGGLLIVVAAILEIAGA